MIMRFFSIYFIYFALSILFDHTLYAQQLQYPKNETISIVDTAVIKPDSSKTDSLITQLLQSNPAYFDSILKYRKQWNVQFIYTQIDRSVNGIPTLKNYYFNVNDQQYFYPASTVKLPICLLALQKLNELKATGITANSTVVIEQALPNLPPAYNDPSTLDGKPTIANYIKKILLVSDNDAYNRLYEVLGRKYINDQLHDKGYDNVQILHRLNIALSDEQNRTTNPVNFYDANNRLLYSQPLQYDSTQYLPRHDSIGNGYYSGKQLIDSPMNFSTKNKISLQNLHDIMLSVVFPQKVTAAQRFNITESDRNFVLKFMSKLPTESKWPPYAADTANYWPAYSKFLLFGAQKTELPKNIRIFNKEGDAYGQLTDIAYIIDYDKKIEFFLSATIYCNADGIINDDHYDYDTIGLPFMKHLGEVIYDYEAKRLKKILPDFTQLQYNYNAE